MGVRDAHAPAVQCVFVRTAGVDAEIPLEPLTVVDPRQMTADNPETCVDEREHRWYDIRMPKNKTTLKDNALVAIRDRLAEALKKGMCSDDNETSDRSAKAFSSLRPDQWFTATSSLANVCWMRYTFLGHGTDSLPAKSSADAQAGIEAIDRALVQLCELCTTPT